jgi:hypothetical protein
VIRRAALGVLPALAVRATLALAAIGGTARAELPACNAYAVWLELRTQFVDRSHGSVRAQWLTDVREVSRPAPDEVHCSGEVLFSRSWARSPFGYVEWTLRAVGTGWRLTVTANREL